MRIYRSEVDRILKLSILVFLPLGMAFFNIIFWSVVDHIDWRFISFLLAFGAPSAIAAIYTLLDNTAVQQGMRWYWYFICCQFYVQTVVFVPSATLDNWGNPTIWFSIGSLIHLPALYVLWLAMLRVHANIIGWRSRFLRYLNIQIIPLEVEKAVVFEYENSKDAISVIEDRLKTLNQSSSAIENLLNEQKASMEREVNALLIDVQHLKNDYVRVSGQLAAEKSEFKKVQHLRSLSDEQVDGLLSRINKAKPRELFAGFFLGVLASIIGSYIFQALSVF